MTQRSDPPRFARLLEEMNRSRPTRAERIVDGIIYGFFAGVVAGCLWIIISGLKTIPQIPVLVP